MHMDESTRNAIIVDAKRRAKAHARTTGESHQKSLDHIARLRGREDWSAFLSDPIAPSERSSPSWLTAIHGRLRRHPSVTVYGAFVFTLVSMVVINLEGASRGGLIDVHVPRWLWLSCAISWGAIFMMIAVGMIAMCVDALKRMEKGVMETRHVTVLVCTILLAVWILTIWRAMDYVGNGVSNLVSVSVVALMMASVMGFEIRAMRRLGRRARRIARADESAAGTTRGQD